MPDLRRALLFSLLLAGCAKKPAEETRFLFNTYCRITIPADGRGTNDVLKKVFVSLETLEKKLSAHNSESPVYQFNNSGTPLYDEEIVSLANIALEVNQKSLGAFDPTLFHLSRLWGFYGTPSLPGDRLIKSTLANTGSEHLVFKNGKIYPGQKGAALDLGGIAAGYAVDEAVKILKASGVKSALIDLGGDIYALGRKKGKLWKVGIKDPRGDGLMGFVELENSAIVTSGDYEKYFEKDGVRYPHILDPKTGYPSRGLQSVTVTGPETVRADAWSTALFVLGPVKGLEIIEKTPDYEALFITDKGEKIFSSGMKERFRQTADND